MMRSLKKYKNITEIIVAKRKRRRVSMYVFKPKYKETVDMRLLRGTEEISERNLIWRKNSLAFYTFR